jgi:hypothetical protein
LYIGNKGLFPRIANPNGRGPPDEKEKARHGENPGRAQQSDTDRLVAQSPKPGNGNLDWCTFYDNARGNTDAAIKAVYMALGHGLIDDSEAAAIDLVLRSQQAKLAGQPTGPTTPHQTSTVRRFKPRRYQCSPDRQTSRDRRRMLARGSHMPFRLHGWRGSSGVRR